MNNLDYILGIDIGGTHFRMGMVDTAFKVSNFTIKPSAILRDDPLPTLIQTLRDYIDQYDPEQRIHAIGIGFPSSVSKDEKRIYSTPNLRGLDNVNIVDTLEQHLQRRVYLSRDVNYLLKYDIVTHQLPQDQIILGFYIGTGFGNSIHINGDFLKGKNGAAGELGHIPLYHNSIQCSCGNEGCLETLASGKHLADLAKQHFPDTPIQQLFAAHGEHAILRDFVYTLSLPIATEINLFDPDHVIIAGGVVAMQGFPKTLLTDYIFKYARKPYPAASLDIIFSAHDTFSGVLGSAYYIHDSLNLKVKSITTKIQN